MTSKEIIEYFENNRDIKWVKVKQIKSEGLVLDLPISFKVPVSKRDNNASQIYFIAKLLGMTNLGG